MTSLPSSMRAVQLAAYNGKPDSLSVVDMPVPKPGSGEVLVKVAASPINPSDLAYLAGMYGFKKPLPTVPGFEGSGTVVATGAGVMTRYLKGRRVACTVADAKIVHGMWAEYVVTKAELCIPLSKQVTMEQGAMMIVNPISAWAMVEEARRAGHKAIVQTAACSALGKMVVRLGQKFGMPIVNVVRRPEQQEVLRGVGAEYIFDSSTADFDTHLRDACHKVKATMGIDAVAGELTGRAMRAQPKGSRMFVYGGLSLKPSEIDPGLLIFEGKVLAGFWVSAWLARKSLAGKLSMTRQIQGMLGNELKSDVQATMRLSEVKQAVEQYMTNMTAGKVLLVP